MSLHVSQIFISDRDRALPPSLAETTNSVRQAFPRARYDLYSGEQLRAFIAEHFGGDVLRAYDCLKPYAFKADLGRYCLIHARGGWYFDLPFRPLAPIDVAPQVEAVLFRDLMTGMPYAWAVSNACFFARAGAPFLTRAIERVVENCRRRDHGMTALSVTGPALFGRALAQGPENPSHLYGDQMRLTPFHRRTNLGFVLPDGTILGWAKQADNGLGLAGYGARTTNNYSALWLGRDVFGPF